MDTTKAVTHIGLCAGYGGIELGLGRVIPNLRSVALCEIEAFAIANLVAKMEAGLMDPAPVWPDLKTFPWGAFRDRVDILTGGYPCQPFSAAGKRAGKEDPRHLWPYIADGIRLLRPRLCFFENVEGHISLGLSDVIEDLAGMGYRTTWGLFSAAEVGAPHQRKRVFILAHKLGARLEGMLHDPATEGRQDAGRPATGCGQHRRDVWPSRPGEQQYGWEPPRVVVNTAMSRCSGQEQQSESDTWIETRVPLLSAGRESVGNPERAELGEISVGGGISNRNDAGREEEADWTGTASKLGDTSNGTRLRDAQGPAGYAAQSDQAVADASIINGERGTPRVGWRTGGQVNDSSRDEEWRKTESTLGLHADESPGVLGQALTLNPNGDNVYSSENISKKASARKVLLEVWNKARTQGFQWEAGRLQRLLAEEVLLSGVQLDGFTQRICFFVWCLQTGHPTQGWGLHRMQVYESSRSASQGQEPIEQLKRELGYAMCQLSYEIALERGQDSLETTGIVQGVRESSERAWALSEALPEMEEVWRSTLDQEVWEKGCFIEAASEGNRTDELRLLGNGVVPATAERAFRVLMDELATNPPRNFPLDATQLPMQQFDLL